MRSIIVIKKLALLIKALLFSLTGAIFSKSLHKSQAIRYRVFMSL